MSTTPEMIAEINATLAAVDPRVYFSTRTDGMLSIHTVPETWTAGSGFAVDPFDWDVDEVGERVARALDTDARMPAFEAYIASIEVAS